MKENSDVDHSRGQTPASTISSSRGMQQSQSNIPPPQTQAKNAIPQNGFPLTGINLLNQMLPNQPQYYLTSPMMNMQNQNIGQINASTSLPTSTPVQTSNQTITGPVANIQKQPQSTSRSQVQNDSQSGAQVENYQAFQLQQLVNSMQQNPSLISNHKLPQPMHPVLPSQLSGSERMHLAKEMQVEFAQMLKYQFHQQQLQQAQLQAMNQSYISQKANPQNPIPMATSSSFGGTLNIPPNTYTNYFQPHPYVQSIQNMQQLQLLMQNQNHQQSSAPLKSHVTIIPSATVDLKDKRNENQENSSKLHSIKPIQTEKTQKIANIASKTFSSSSVSSNIHETNDKKQNHSTPTGKRKSPSKSDKPLSKKPHAHEKTKAERRKSEKKSTADSITLNTIKEKESQKPSKEGKTSLPRKTMSDKEAQTILDSLPWEEQLIYVARAVMGGRATNGYFKALSKVNEIVNNLEVEEQKKRSEAIRMSGLVDIGNILGHKPLDSTAKLDLLKRKPDVALQMMVEMGHGVDFCDMMSSTIQNILKAMKDNAKLNDQATKAKAAQTSPEKKDSVLQQEVKLKSESNAPT